MLNILWDFVNVCDHFLLIASHTNQGCVFDKKNIVDIKPDHFIVKHAVNPGCGNYRNNSSVEFIGTTQYVYHSHCNGQAVDWAN